METILNAETAADFARAQENMTAALPQRRLDPDAAAAALSMYYPDIPHEELSELCRELQMGAVRGRALADRAFEQEGATGIESAARELERILQGYSPAERRDVLTDMYCRMLAELPPGTVVPGRKSEFVMKAELILMAKNRGEIAADALLRELQMRRPMETLTASPETDTLFAAAQCAAFRVDLRESGAAWRAGLDAALGRGVAVRLWEALDRGVQALARAAGRIAAAAAMGILHTAERLLPRGSGAQTVAAILTWSAEPLKLESVPGMIVLLNLSGMQAERAQRVLEAQYSCLRESGRELAAETVQTRSVTHRRTESERPAPAEDETELLYAQEEREDIVKA